MLSNIIILMIFAVFVSSPLSTMDKLQFLIFIFDVLLTNLCNVSMYHSFNGFPKLWQSAILDLLRHIFGPPTKFFVVFFVQKLVGIDAVVLMI